MQNYELSCDKWHELLIFLTSSLAACRVVGGRHSDSFGAKVRLILIDLSSSARSNKSGVMCSNSNLFWHKPENNKTATIDHPQQPKGTCYQDRVFTWMPRLFGLEGIPILIVELCGGDEDEMDENMSRTLDGIIKLSFHFTFNHFL